MAARAVTRREADVLDALVDRPSNAEIAAALRLSERTVESHVSALMHKLGARDRTELARLARQRADAAATHGLPPMIGPLTRRGPFVGRGDETARLLAWWDRTTSDGSSVAIVTGEAGIGKSSLAAHLATAIGGRGGRVLLGSCTDGTQVPYQPFVEMLTDDLAAISDFELRRRSHGHEQGLARIIPAAGTRMRLLPAAPVVDRVHERDTAQIALHAYLTEMADAHPTLFVIEDLHWASDATRDMLARFARTPTRAPLMILATARDTAPDLDEALERFLGAMVRVPSVEVVALTGLDVAPAAALLAELGSAIDVEQAVQDTGGNPLFLREVATAGHGSRTIRELVGDRFARLGADDLDVVDVAAVIGEVFPVPLVAEAASRSPSDVVAALERADAAGLVVVDAGLGRCAFVHAVFRDVRYDTRSARGARCGSTPLSHGRSNRAPTIRGCLPSSPDMRASPCLSTGPWDAVGYARRAGDHAVAAADHGAAVEQYSLALEALELVDAPDEQLRLLLTIRLGEGLVLSGERRGRDMLLDAARWATPPR